jgi:hypothetical protein
VKRHKDNAPFEAQGKEAQRTRRFAEKRKKEKDLTQRARSSEHGEHREDSGAKGLE